MTSVTALHDAVRDGDRPCFNSDAVETIGFAARRLGSAIVSIAAMRMSEVARVADVYMISAACHMPARGMRGGVHGKGHLT